MYSLLYTKNHHRFGWFCRPLSVFSSFFDGIPSITSDVLLRFSNCEIVFVHNFTRLPFGGFPSFNCNRRPKNVSVPELWSQKLAPLLTVARVEDSQNVDLLRNVRVFFDNGLRRDLVRGQSFTKRSTILPQRTWSHANRLSLTRSFKKKKQEKYEKKIPVLISFIYKHEQSCQFNNNSVGKIISSSLVCTFQVFLTRLVALFLFALKTLSNSEVFGNW